MLSEQEFKSFLKKSPGTNNSYVSSLKSKVFLDYANSIGVSNVFTETDISIIKALYDGLCDKTNTLAMASVKSCNGASRSAIREYADYLRKMGYATHDSDQLFVSMKPVRTASGTTGVSSKPLKRVKTLRPTFYTFSFLNDLISLIGRKKIIRYMVEHSLFFSERTVNAAHEIMLERILNEKGSERIPFPVRKSTKLDDLYVLGPDRSPVMPKKNCFVYNQDAFGYKGMYLSIDKDGNSQLRQLINGLTQAKPSQGASNSNIDFGKISHIWGQAFRPYLFTSLWNVVIVPAYLNDLLDKHADNAGFLSISDSDEVLDERERKIIEKIQHIYRCICWIKYDVENKLKELGVDAVLIDEMRPKDLTGFNIHDYRIVEIGYNYNKNCKLGVSKPSIPSPEPEIPDRRFNFPISNKAILDILNK